jgi:4-amino-4-deoxychorismate lyase
MSAFHLIETMRWENGGIVRLPLHLARLRHSADQLGFKQPHDIRKHLLNAIPVHGLGSAPALRVRLTLDAEGRVHISSQPYIPLEKTAVWRVRIAATRIDSCDIWLRHKTNRRSLYDAARAEYLQEEADEVLLLNERREACEGTITSIFLDDGSGPLKTPSLSSGLLAGVLRAELICTQRARIQRLTLNDLTAGQLYLGNSLRGLVRAEVHF